MYVDLIHRQQERNEDISPEIAVSGGAICPQHLFEQMLTVLHVKKVKVGILSVFLAEFRLNLECSTVRIRINRNVGRRVSITLRR